MRVLIDPGHAPGNANGGKKGYKEYAGMWKLSNMLKDILTAAGATAQLTRTESANPSLDARGGMARGFDVFISQHSNAANGTARGSECFFSVTQPNNRATAARLSKEIAALFNHNDRGAKTKAGNGSVDYYGVIRAAVAAGCPRVFLMESGFHDNVQDEAFLLKDENLRKIAEVQARILMEAVGFTAKPTPEAPPNLTHISGKSVATAAQMRAYIKSINPDAPDLADIFISEGLIEGIRGDIAFAQSCLETGNFKFTGGTAVTLDQNNFCGMGVTQMGIKGNSFPTPQIGIRAQIHHLKAYANKEPWVNENQSPRAYFVQRGIAPYVEWLGAQENPQGKGWAMGAGYGEKILRILSAIIATEASTGPPQEELVVDKAIADGIITDRAHWLGVLTGSIKPNPAFIKIMMENAHAKINRK